MRFVGSDRREWQEKSRRLGLNPRDRGARKSQDRALQTDLYHNVAYAVKQTKSWGTESIRKHD